MFCRCPLKLEGLRCFVNDEGTRSFVSIPVTQGMTEVRTRHCHYVCMHSGRTLTGAAACSHTALSVMQVVRLIRAVDSAFKLHSLQTYFQDPQPHMSVAWVLGNQLSNLQAAVDKLCGAVTAPCLQMDLRRVLCRVGVREHVLWEAEHGGGRLSS